MTSSNLPPDNFDIGAKPLYVVIACFWLVAAYGLLWKANMPQLPTLIAGVVITIIIVAILIALLRKKK